MKKNQNRDRPRSETDYKKVAGACISYGVGDSKPGTGGKAMFFGDKHASELWGKKR